MKNAATRQAQNRPLSQEATSFFRKVYAVVRTIPKTRVLTYGQIATLLGAPTMARQVGWAMHGCPQGLPWQRVVGANGKLLINSQVTQGGALLQRQLLEAEGVQFVGNHVDMHLHQYFPSRLKKLHSERLKKGNRSKRR